MSRVQRGTMRLTGAVCLTFWIEFDHFIYFDCYTLNGLDTKLFWHDSSVSIPYWPLKAELSFVAALVLPISGCPRCNPAVVRSAGLSRRHLRGNWRMSSVFRRLACRWGRFPLAVHFPADVSGQRVDARCPVGALCSAFECDLAVVSHRFRDRDSGVTAH